MAIGDYIKSITEPFKALPKWQKFVVFGFATAAFVGLIFVALMGSKVDYAVLFSNLEPADAGQIVKVLQSKGVPYKLEKDGTTILVPKDKVYSLRLELAGQGLPKGGGVGFEIFDKTNIGMTQFLEHVTMLELYRGNWPEPLGSLSP